MATSTNLGTQYGFPHYAELTCKTNFSFLEGASHPEEMVNQAKALGLSALAITDRNGLYGIVRAHVAAKEVDLPLIIGSTLPVEWVSGSGLTGGPPAQACAGTPPVHHPPPIQRQQVVLLAMGRKGYANLCRLITALKKTRDESAALTYANLQSYHEDLSAMIPWPYRSEMLEPLRDIFGDRLSIALHRVLDAEDSKRSREAKRWSRKFSIPIVATNDVYYHVSERQALQDVLTATRLRTTVQEAGYALFPNAERRLKSPIEMAALFSDLPAAIQRTVEIAEQCQFSLDELRYIYPDEFLPAGFTSAEYLAKITWEGAKARYPNGIPGDVSAQIQHELKLIQDLKFSDYFLTIYDIVTYARSRQILCQGRGSAANSAVCFVLGITAIDPVRMKLLFERFISAERGEPPDIDVDFEHERREEVIQYIYQRYGRDRAGITAEVITYRTKSAIRDVSKALGVIADLGSGLTGGPPAHSRAGTPPVRHPSPPSLERLIQEIKGFPRHISTHVGGFVLTRDPLIESVPVEKAAMEGRTIIQWDKNDLDAVGMLKVDVLGLGMLTCIRKCFALLKDAGKDLTLETVPGEDPKVYDMIGKGDTVGVFQIESRAQMGMLPRLLPRTFFDLVVEVAIVRPGPIIGKMVHPYLRRRRGEEVVKYPHPALEEILGKTYGVPLFQEQVMKIAVAVADFTPGEADQLRRAMGIWRTSRSASMTTMAERLVAGMRRHGIPEVEAVQICNQIKSFGEFGFPESHSASFALLVYISAYLKCYFPAYFACSLLNSLPMGFYMPHSIVDDLRRHHGRILPVDVASSDWDCTMEGQDLRLGFRLVRGLGERVGRALAEERRRQSFVSIEDFVERVPVNRMQAAFLASAGVFDSMKLDRRQAMWKTLSTPFNREDLFSGTEFISEEEARLPKLSMLERVATDYRMTGLSLFAHPVGMYRRELREMNVSSIAGIESVPNARKVRVAGLVIVRQRPPTAKGMVFMTLEDETAMLNVAIRPNVYERIGAVVRSEPFLIIDGKLQRDGKALSVLVWDVFPFRLGQRIAVPSRNFH